MVGSSRVAWIVMAACGFRHGVVPHDGLGDDVQADVAGDVAHDAPVATTIYATDVASLYTIDVASKTYALVAGLHDSTGASVPGVDSLAYVEGQLIEVGRDGVGQAIGTIDPQTALVMSKPPLSNGHEYYGMTYIPETRSIVAAAADDGQLYRVDPVAGTMTAIGPFGNGLAVYGDLAWLGGTLYATMRGTTCTNDCFGTIDPATGTATVLTYTMPSTMPSLSGFGGKLYAFSTGGDVYEVSKTDGSTTLLFNVGGIDMGDTAP
jgi:hypothetical protein